MDSLTEFFKKHGINKGEDVMWASVDILSKAIEEHLSPEESLKIQKKLHYLMCGGHYDKEFAEMQLPKLYYTENGIDYKAPYWTENDVKSVYDSVRNDIRGYNFYDFEVALNMIRSDYYLLVKKWFPNSSEDEMTRKFIDLPVNWLNDSDNPFGEEKVWLYFNSR